MHLWSLSGTLYGYEIDWQAVVSPTSPPAELLQQYLEDARHGDGPDGELVWQTVLQQSFDMVRQIYLGLSLEYRRRFDKTCTSFFLHMQQPSQPSMLKKCWRSRSLWRNAVLLNSD
jgi:hypothetical protein